MLGLFLAPKIDLLCSFFQVSTFYRFWSVLGEFWEGLGRAGEVWGRVWTGFGRVFGNICLKFWVNVPQCLGRCSQATGQNEVGPADRAQRLNPPHPAKDG